MRYPILAGLFVLFVATPAAHAQKLEDFSNIARAIGKDVSVVDRKGLILEGIVDAVTLDAVTLRIGSATHVFPRGEIASAERLKDESSDGAIKGAIWALVLVLMPNQGYTGAGDYLRGVATAFAFFPTVGYLLDAAQSNRQPIYRAPLGQAPTLKVTWRF